MITNKHKIKTEVIKMRALTKDRLIMGLLILGIGVVLAWEGNAQAGPQEREIGSRISQQAIKLGYIPGEVMVKLAPGVSMPPIDTNKEFPFKEKKHLFGTWYKLKFDKGVDMDKLKNWLNNFSEIQKVEFNHIIEQQIVPRERIDQKWGLEKIQAPQAWNYETGSPEITIAVIDSGVDIDHEDLKDNITLGHDYVNNDDTPQDDTQDSHGTHVAGIIGAVGDNGKGTTGVMWDVNLLIIKALDRDGLSPVDRMVKAITDVADKGPDIINMSWGVDKYSIGLKEAIDYAYGNGCILIAAGGNEGSDIPFYPASYNNVIGVTATNKDDRRPSWSNFGDKYDIAAPGKSIYSTIEGEKGESSYGELDGTSMSAAFVSGVAGLMLSLDPYARVRSILKDTADSINTSKPPHIRLNAYKAVKEVYEEEPPEKPIAVASVGEVGQKSIEVEIGEEVQFYSEGSSAPEGESLQYMWIFDDGGYSNEANPTHIFDEEDTYSVSLIVMTNSQISDPDNVTVKVGEEGGLVELVAEPSEGIAPLEVKFEAKITGQKEAKEVEWDFGDEEEVGYGAAGLTGDTITYHTYQEAGTYTATVTVTFEDDTEASDSEEIKVKLIELIAEPTEGVAPLEVEFRVDTGQKEAKEVEWIFGDEEVVGYAVQALAEDETIVYHTYKETGTYTASVTVTFEDDTEASDSEEIKVKLIELIAEPTEGVAPLEVEFRVDTGQKEAKEVEWIFGDEEEVGYAAQALAEDETIVYHTYQEAGTYTATVTVTFEDDTEASDSEEILVKAEGEVPKAVIEADKTSGPIPLKVVFSGKKSEAPEDGEIVRYSWDFGDGSAKYSGKYLVKIAHIYTEKGTYTATLTVTDDEGNKDSDSIKIEPGTKKWKEATIYGTVTGRFRRGRRGVIDVPGRGGLMPGIKVSAKALGKDGKDAGDVTTDNQGKYSLKVEVRGNGSKFRVTARDPRGLYGTASKETPHKVKPGEKVQVDIEMLARIGPIEPPPPIDDDDDDTGGGTEPGGGTGSGDDDTGGGTGSGDDDTGSGTGSGDDDTGGGTGSGDDDTGGGTGSGDDDTGGGTG